jgi:DNA-binding MarR family transcriptional regulator
MPTPRASADQREAEIAQRALRHWREAVPNDRMAHLVKDAMRALHRALQTRLAQHGVQPGHWVFLRVLWLHDGLTQRELSIEAGVMEPTTFVALRAMAALGYVTLDHRAGNRKNVYATLTPLGRQLESTLVPLAEHINTLALQGLSTTDIATTRRALLAMIDNLAQDGQRQEGAAAPGLGR